MLKIIENTKWWFAFSLTIIAIGLVMLVYRGSLNLGIDFRGGSIIQLNMTKDFDKGEVDNLLSQYTSEYESNKANNNTEYYVKVKSGAIKNEDVSSFVKAVQDKFGTGVALISYDDIGPSVGNDLKQKAIVSLSIAIAAMLVYVGIRFEIKFGAAAVIALVHDVLITLCVYIIFNIPINLSFIAAMLTIIGYSMNDTIVIFDRIRENLQGMRRAPVNEVVNVSISQTIVRSIYTVTTTLITTTCVYIFVPIASVREFALPLIIGIASGCYSSIFIASPFWVIFRKNRRAARA